MLGWRDVDYNQVCVWVYTHWHVYTCSSKRLLQSWGISCSSTRIIDNSDCSLKLCVCTWVFVWWTSCVYSIYYCILIGGNETVHQMIRTHWTHWRQLRLLWSVLHISVWVVYWWAVRVLQVDQDPLQHISVLMRRRCDHRNISLYIH